MMAHYVLSIVYIYFDLTSKHNIKNYKYNKLIELKTEVNSIYISYIPYMSQKDYIYDNCIGFLTEPKKKILDDIIL